MLFAYFSPDVTLLVPSFLAAAAGVIMMVGRAPFRLAARGIKAGLTALKRIGNKRADP